MSRARRLMLFCLLLMLLPACALASAGGAFTLPCEAELSPFLSGGEHEIIRRFDLAEWYRMHIDNWEDDLMVESGSLIILDHDFMIMNLRFSRDYENDTELDICVPEVLTLTNQDLNARDDTDPPLWQVTVYPDADDPYAFHYAGSWNNDMFLIKFYGSYTNPQGETRDCFSLDVAF